MKGTNRIKQPLAQVLLKHMAEIKYRGLANRMFNVLRSTVRSLIRKDMYILVFALCDNNRNISLYRPIFRFSLEKHPPRFVTSERDI